MENIHLKDYLVSRVLSTGRQVDGYKEIYYQTTEDLIIPYIDVDFYNKEVLSVLASSDHIFTARYLEAKKVDAFDINHLALYYFYLRIWSIKYMNTLYPPILEDDTFLEKLLPKVKPSTEMEKVALWFYQKHLENGTKFFYLFNRVDKQPPGRTLFTKPEELQDCLDSNLTFYNIDLFTRFNLTSTYDILLISNILDWARNDTTRLQIAAENISKLLKRDGAVICHSLVSRTKEEKKKEQEIFNNDFYLEEQEKGYVYIKR